MYSERSSFKLNSRQLAIRLTTELTGNYNYVVVDNEQLFSQNMKLDGESYIPVVLNVVTSFPDPNKFITTEVYQLHFRVDKNIDILNFYNDIETFRSGQSDELIDSEYVTKTYQKVIYAGQDVIEGIEYSMFTLEFTWVYSLSIVGSQALIKIDDVSIPFIELDIAHDKAYISNEASGSSYRMTNDIILLTVPLILSNSGITTIFNYINSDSYNTEFDLSINGVVKTVVLKRGQVRYLKNGLITNMILTLETAYPRVTFTLDGEVIPNTQWEFSMKSTTTEYKRKGDGVTGQATGKVKGWNVTLVKDGSTVYDKVVADMYSSTLNQTYTLVKDGYTFTVILSDVMEAYAETGDMAINCRFTEYE
jgi:hypothetical protein